MENEILNKVFLSIRHQNLEAAIFHLSLTSYEYKELLLGILYYKNSEYLRSINYLSKFKTKTSLFYSALSYIKMKEYKMAGEFLNNISNNNFAPDTDSIYKDFYITDNEYIYELQAECLTQVNDREEALNKYMDAVSICLLPRSCKNVLLENKSFPLKNGFDKEKMLYEDLINFKNTKNPVILQKYNEKSEFSLFLISEAARLYFEDGNNQEAINLFNKIKSLDNQYFNNIDIYSTILWHQKDNVSLGFLSRKLIDSRPKSRKTWLVLGNYFSLKGDHERSIECFKRSIIIETHHYSLTLLGHEYIMKQDYSMAAKYFSQSIKRSRNNYNAFFGLGLVYNTMCKFENAEFYLKKAKKANPNNLVLIYYIMQFYNGIKEYKKAINSFCEVFKCNFNNINIPNILSSYNLDENREIIILETIDFYIYNDQDEVCNYILENVRYRGKIYYQKQKLLNRNTDTD